MAKVLLSGKPGSGKSTVFRRAVEILQGGGLGVRGIATPDVRDARGARLGFDVVDLATGRRAPLARAPSAADPGAATVRGPRVGRYVVDVAAFESVARPALERARPAVTGSDLIAIDEVGTMELLSDWFARTWRGLVDSQTDVLAVVGSRYLGACRGKGHVFEVTRENRDTLPEQVADHFGRPRRAAPA